MDKIRTALPSDIGSITDIYNQAIRAKTCTCDTVEFSPDDRVNWFNEHQNGRYPIFVCERNGVVAGYSYISSYRKDHEAVQSAGEISYYVDFAFHRQGSGTKLIEHTLCEAKKRKYENLLAIVLDCNAGSISLLKKFGFIQWGCLPEIALLGGAKYSHLYYGKRL